MILPRRLFLLGPNPGPGQFCEEDDPRQAMNFRAKGFIIPDAEAERMGLIAYLNETGWDEVAHVKADMPAAVYDAEPEPDIQAKAVAQSEVEDKAIDPPASVHHSDEVAEQKDGLEPGLHIDPAQRRGGRRGS